MPFVSSRSPPPSATATAKPSATAAKGDAAKPAADAGKAVGAPAKPIPSDPAKLVAEVIDASGVRQSFLVVAREIAVNAVADESAGAGPAAADAVDPRPDLEAADLAALVEAVLATRR